jgi:superfamily I DNA/RNA helicase
MLNVDIDKVSWQSLGNSIRGAVSGFESLSSYEEWIRFYTRLKEEYREKAARISEEFRNGIQDLVDSTQAKFKRNEEQWKSFDEELHSRFEKKISSEVEDEEGEIEDVEEEEEALQGGLKYDYDVELNRLLRRLIRIGALSEYDRNTRFSKKAREDYNKVEPFIDKSFFAVIGEGALFRKYFDKLTRGVERSLMRDLSRSYKGFRRTVLLTSDLLTENGKRELAGFISAENKKVSEDEMELLLLCTCHTVHSLFRIDPTLFSNSAYPQIQGFRSHAKAVVAIDEATDFAPLQLACMASLSHPRFSCFTLSGDLMQRLNKNGLISWKEFTLLHPDTEIRKINISYRQTPKLLNIAKEIYRKQLGVEPDFNSDTTDGVGDPDALLFKHSLFETRVDWIAERIVEIHKIYGNSIPSIAIFFKNDSHMLEYAKELSRHESLMELDISVAACANGNVLGDPESVRLFAVEYIKGMEFEVVFFVDIDSIANEYPEMIDKYVYVGLSRANLYLAVTVQNEFPRALSYLEPMFSKQGTWLV